MDTRQAPTVGKRTATAIERVAAYERVLKASALKRENADGGRVGRKRRSRTLPTMAELLRGTQPADTLTIVRTVADQDYLTPGIIAAGARPKHMVGWACRLPWYVSRKGTHETIKRVSVQVAKATAAGIDWAAMQQLFGSNTAKMESDR